MHAPNVLQEHRSGYNPALMASEALDHGELPGRQVDPSPRALDAARQDINHEITNDDRIGRHALASANQSVKPSRKFREAERLGQVVVGAEIQPLNAVLDGIPRRQANDRRLHLAIAQFPQHAEPITARKHQIEHDRVVGVRQGQASPVHTIGRMLDGVRRFRQALANESSNARIVLDHEDSHPNRSFVNPGPVRPGTLLAGRKP